jgi:DNA-binding CsgD family transcriptional regulator/tetratricopeptide (TPR) repeat protein
MVRGQHTSQRRRRSPNLLGRRSECEGLDRLVADARAGRSGVIVLRGEAGVGKSALLDYVSDRVSGWHIACAVGVESEMELAYSGLHQLCAPMMDRADRLPDPQRDALATVFGLSARPAPDRFLVGLATLTLFAEVAEHQPLVCIVDDAQWLDHASAQVLGFVARRLHAERIAVVCAARTDVGDPVLVGLPELLIQGLGDDDSRTLLLGHVLGPLDPAVCDQIVTECHGNPLALLELPRTWKPAELAGGFGLPASKPVAGKIEQSYVERLLDLPADTRLFIAAAAAEPLGDLSLLARAAQVLGLDMTVVDPAVEAGLLKVGTRVEFSHPLVRSAAYRSTSNETRQRVHRALAESTDPDNDPDRRVWHHARATAGPSEAVAADLERSAQRAQARGGLAAAAAFLQRSVALTDDPNLRGERALAAAQASLQAGSFDTALNLLTAAAAGPLDEFQRARVDLVRAHVAFASGFGSDAPALLMNAARGLEPFDLSLARETYLSAWGAAEISGSLGHGILIEICGAVQALPPSTGAPLPLDLLLDGLALLITDGHAAAVPILQRAARELTNLSLDEVLRWGWMATFASSLVWDIETFQTISSRHVQMVRDAGAVSQLPLYLWQLAHYSMWTGDLPGAASLAAESESVGAATGSPLAPYTLLRLRALQGSESDLATVLERTSDLAEARGQGVSTSRRWAEAVLWNGLGRYEEAAEAAQEAASDLVTRRPAMWALAELVEAASRHGDLDVARDALERLTLATQPCDTDFARGVEARCRALLSDGAEAERWYRESIERLSRSRLRPDHARARLVYGEWLRREGRRVDARDQLRRAHDMLVAIGMEAFAERARRELVATGEKVRKRDDSRQRLTPQEEQIARLARDGLSNPEIGAQLFISARTVEWHLRKVFTKLDISSRRQLGAALPKDSLTFVDA